MQGAKDPNHLTFTFRVDKKTKEYAKAYTSYIHSDLSKWIKQVAESYLIEQKVLGENRELNGGWGDENRRKEKCPRRKKGSGFDATIGVRIDKASPLYVGLLNYASGNSTDALNFSDLLAFLVQRELRLEEVITKSGNLTAKWAERLERKKLAA